MVRLISGRTRRPGGRQAKSPDALAQIKTRERVRALAEVYTHEREVTGMLGLIPDMFTKVDTRFLEPACGSGNFLVAILARKLALVASRRHRSQGAYEHMLLRCAASIYGIDISSDNVWEAHDRMGHVVFEHYSLDANTWVPTEGFVTALDEILRTNIICADTMKEADAITFIEYEPGPRQTFLRTPKPMVEPALTLFYTAPVPLPKVHYSKLAIKMPK